MQPGLRGAVAILGRPAMVIIAFFIAHWIVAMFVQSFFLHRYAAHRMCTMSPGWERFFHGLTFLAQGSSYLDPRGYGILHRAHHAYSDTPKDPHSPTNHSGPGALAMMMWRTRQRYEAVAYGGPAPEERFDGDAPRWPLLDRLAPTWTWRLVIGASYTAVYFVFATAWWQWLLLPVQFLMGPVHGAVVNWCGHKYGYRNHASNDQSRNTLPLEFVCGGELLQNNHHQQSSNPNFAHRWFEVDPTYQVMRVLAAVGIIQMKGRDKRSRQPLGGGGRATAPSGHAAQAPCGGLQLRIDDIHSGQAFARLDGGGRPGDPPG